MKKAILVLSILGLAILVQSCGAGDKCPAYSKANVEMQGANG